MPEQNTAKKMMDEEKSEFITYPTNKVVGFIDREEDALAALEDLSAAGFGADDIEVLTGQEGADRIDVRGKKHGTLARMVRALHRMGEFEVIHARQHTKELLAGHYGIGVTANKEKDREKILEIMKSHGGHDINFYGVWYVEYLHGN